MIVEIEHGTCPWCNLGDTMTREIEGVPFHAINVPNPEHPSQLIGVEIRCLKLGRTD